ncbi:MAG TPA: hypothetical protein VMV44_02750 [Rectinemataceae bacterium]|nr:hypothetical protein [Rectinemataceae bacterium]
MKTVMVWSLSPTSLSLPPDSLVCLSPETRADNPELSTKSVAARSMIRF